MIRSDDDEESSMKLSAHGLESLFNDNSIPFHPLADDDRVAETTCVDSFEGGSRKPKVFISYNWQDAKKLAEMISEKLKEKSYERWIDDKDMGVDMKDAMYKGVAECDVFLMFASPNYQKSRSCRQEAELADSKGKVIIPVHPKPGFKSTGWLGVLEAGKLYFDLCEEDFEKQFNKLFQEIEKQKLP